MKMTQPCFLLYRKVVSRKQKVYRPTTKFPPFLLFTVFLFTTSFAQLLPQEEVKVLETISSKLQNKYWNVSRRSCGDGTGFNIIFTDIILSNVTCDCSFSNNTVCHVITIQLKSLNLTGTLPAEIANLTHLTELDLARNYINGSIPAVFSQLPLTILGLYGNRLSGRIPDEIGEIRSLQQLNLEDNLLGGPLPKSLGRLSNLSRLMLSANNFTGPIPETFGNLKNLNDLRLDGNAISGKIPDFIGNWTKLGWLDMQGTLLEGPIPSSISALKNLTSLRILGLNASSMAFPNLEGMISMHTLILRNCSIVGEVPAYIGGMAKLKTLDLSYNVLTGLIPNTLPGLNFVDLFLAANSFTGEIPPLLLGSKQNVDLSYNNFTETRATNCFPSTINLVSSYSSSTSNSAPWCSKKDLPCSQKPQYYSLFINCGGSSTIVDDNSYEQDSQPEGRSYFYSTLEKWAYSSSGVYLGNDDANYIATNSFSLSITGGELYKTARLAPSSLKYYGLCLRKGSYSVHLHFAEIMFSNDTTFSSLGKRIFDVSIQGRVVLQDFNIMKEAGGVGIGIIKEFNDVLVNGSTLEIHLYWTGKGTTAIPDRGVYGPLISAITVKPNFDTSTGLSTGAIIGVVVALCILVAAVLFLILALRRKGYLGGKSAQDQELKSLHLQTGYFTLRRIKAATRNFDPINKIGEGGFGPVYKGVLADGAVIAVKQLSSKSKQGNREFVTEIGMISALHHPNLVKLYGCCIEGNQLMLVYEYMENNSLARALFGDHKQQPLNLDWETRKKISLGIARGLTYLHEESRIKIVHRDIKATNVLLDKDLNAKISDFGLAKLNEEENTHISTRIAGTIGYMAPEYAMRGYLTDKADVYSFGVVMLEIVSGKSNTNCMPREEFVYLLDWAYVLQNQGKLLELVDPSLGTQYPAEEAMTMLNVALLCTNPSPTLRPSMSSVVKMLQGKIPVQAPSIKRNPSMSGDDAISFNMVSEHTVSSAMTTLSLNVGSFITLRLNSKNYPLWREQALSLAESQDLIDHLTNPNLAPAMHNTTTASETSTPPTITTEYTNWKKADRILKGWIIGSLSEESLGLVIGLDSAYAVWQALKSAYAQNSQEREFNLRQQLVYLRKDTNQSVNEHIWKFKECSDSLAAIGKPVPDEEKVYYLLTSLGSSYETFTTTMLKPPRPTYTELVSQLQSLDQRRSWLSRQTDHAEVLPGSQMAFFGQKQSNYSNNMGNQNSNKGFTSTGRGFTAQNRAGNSQNFQVKFERMSTSEREKYRDETCQYCGIKGHVSQICWWYLKKKAEDNSVPKALAALTLDNNLVDTEWTLDTGASNHMVSDSGQGYRSNHQDRETQG